MLDGIYYNPTKIFFGQSMETKVGEEVAKYSKKILLHFGGSSFKKHGLYDRVAASLKVAGVEYVELGGVKSNPCVGLVYKGIELCREENIDFILAVGGGSVIDSAKAISIGVPWRGDFFDFYEGKQIPRSALKIATILTIPGTGSESSPSSVITHEEKKTKSVCSNFLMFPTFSILNPEITYTLTDYQTSCGIVDAISHVLERYFTNTDYVDCTDRISGGLIQTLMKYALLVKNEPNNYNVRAEIMWACKLAHDNVAGFGRKQDWASHAIAHAIGAITDIAHGAILSVIFPAWLRYVHRINFNKFIQFAFNIFSIKDSSIEDKEAVLLAIDKFREFLKNIGMPLTLRELGIANKTQFDEIARKCVLPMPSGTIGSFVRLSPSDVVKILKIAY